MTEGLVWRVLSVLLACALLTLPAGALNPDRRISQYAHASWRLQDGYLGSMPITVTQTADGYIWVGTQAGIRRFDGVRFVDWAPSGGEEIRSTFVYKLLGTDDGSLWIGATGLGLWRWKDGHLTRFLRDMPFDVMSIVDGGKGSVWVALMKPSERAGALCEITGSGQTHCYSEAVGLPDVCCTAIARDRNGQLWVAGVYELIKWHPPGVSSRVFTTPRPFAVGNNLTSVVIGVDGRVVLGDVMSGSRVGLQQMSGGHWSPLKIGAWDSSTSEVMALLLDSHQTLWVGAERGLKVIRNGEVDHFGAEDGLSSDTVFSLYEDREGDIWAATARGIDCFKDLTVATTSIKEGLASDDHDSVFASRDGTVWATGYRTIDAIRESKVDHVKLEQKLTGVGMTALYETHKGDLIVGGSGELNLFSRGKLIAIPKPQGTSFGLVISIAGDAQDHIWAETSGPRQLLRLEGPKVTQVLSAAQIPAARKLAVDAHGDLWLGLLTGDLARYSEGKLDIFHYALPPHAFPTSLIVARDGSVLGATDSGLVGWRNGKQQLLTVKNGLPCDAVNAVLEDRHGALWLYMQCGLVQISKSEFDAWWNDSKHVLQTKVFDSLDGVQPGAAAFQGAAEGSDGKLWFANGFALQVIDPDHLGENTVSPPVHVEEIIAEGRTLLPTRDLTLPALTRNVSFRYTALSFVSPQRVLFRYRLEGQETAWQDANTRREAFYTNLSPGNYRFRVIACNNNGLWNEVGDSISFKIAPTFYQTTWFTVLCGVSLICILSLVYAFRLRQAQVQLEERIGARLEERERISRELHDTLLQGFQGLMLRFQSVLKAIPEHQPARKMLEDVLDRADGVLLEGRLSVRELRAKRTGDDFGRLVAQCGEELSQSYSIPFRQDVLGTARRLDPLVCEEAFRIAREALFNAFQHSGATQIEAELSYGKSEVRLRVRDNGIGIKASILNEGRPDHWGLLGMRERAKAIRSELEIWSVAGAGTELELRIPSKIAHPDRLTYLHWLRLGQRGKTNER